jgi:hypothetical protein
MTTVADTWPLKAPVFSGRMLAKYAFNHNDADTNPDLQPEGDPMKPLRNGKYRPNNDHIQSTTASKADVRALR